MGGLSIWHYLILGVVILLLFGKGRFSGMMGDVAEGIKSFKKGMADDDAAPTPTAPPTRIEGRTVNDAPAATTETRESDHTA
ncbi:MAG: twin-arginine translocase TatA/TatE family subunit [Pseudomonadota bacterium]